MAIRLSTQAALEISEQFDEILIDEYQDSNCSGNNFKEYFQRTAWKPNRFMVGDVKKASIPSCYAGIIHGQV